MLHKIDPATLAAAIAQAVTVALAALEPAAPETPARVAATCSPLEFSQISGVGLSRVRDYLHAGRIKHVRSGRRILIPRAEIDAFFAREMVGGQK